MYVNGSIPRRYFRNTYFYQCSQTDKTSSAPLQLLTSPTDSTATSPTMENVLQLFLKEKLAVPLNQIRLNPPQTPHLHIFSTNQFPISINFLLPPPLPNLFLNLWLIQTSPMLLKSPKSILLLQQSLPSLVN